jgi:Tfp pilus assembly protein PilO
MKSANRLTVSMVLVAALAVAFWVLALGPKRQEAEKLASQVSQLHASVAESQTKVSEALTAQHQFPVDYQQLVVLGKAVPPSDETSSLLIQLDDIAYHSKVSFDSIQLGSSSTESSSASITSTTPATTAGGSAGTVPPTEAAASLLPLGATIGPAGLGVMPYDLSFSGNFFHIADFIRGVDSLVHTGGKGVGVNGRLVTLNGFALNAKSPPGSTDLNATFSVTTYLIPPSQGITAGATAAAPAATSTATPTASTTSPPATGTTSGTSTSSTPASTSTSSTTK